MAKRNTLVFWIIAELLLIGAAWYTFCVPRVEVMKNRPVWIQGFTYHTRFCQYVTQRSKKVPVCDAMADGKGPCKVCNPGGWKVSHWEALQYKASVDPDLASVELTGFGVAVNALLVLVTVVVIMANVALVKVTRDYVKLTNDLVEEAKGQREEMEKQRVNSVMPAVSPEWVYNKEQANHHWVVSIKNQGVGPALHTKVVARYMNNTKEIYPGGGIGMTIGPLGPGQSQQFSYLTRNVVGENATRLTVTYQDIYGRRFKTEALVGSGEIAGVVTCENLDEPEPASFYSGAWWLKEKKDGSDDPVA